MEIRLYLCILFYGIILLNVPNISIIMTSTRSVVYGSWYPVTFPETTIATATADQIDGGDIALSFADLILSIVVAFNEPEFDYWGNVKAEVETVVGLYINEHNMNQVEAFEGDLETLLLRCTNLIYY